MKLNRFILMLSIVVIALQGAGAAKTLHNISHHCSDSISRSCDGNADHQNPSKQAPTTPSDDPTDEDCQLCLSLHSLTPTLSEPTPLPEVLPALQLQITRPLTVVCTFYTTADHPVRGPPLS